MFVLPPWLGLIQSHLHSIGQTQRVMKYNPFSIDALLLFMII